MLVTNTMKAKVKFGIGIKNRKIRKPKSKKKCKKRKALKRSKMVNNNTFSTAVQKRLFNLTIIKTIVYYNTFFAFNFFALTCAKVMYTKTQERVKIIECVFFFEILGIETAKISTRTHEDLRR